MRAGRWDGYPGQRVRFISVDICPQTSMCVAQLCLREAFPCVWCDSVPMQRFKYVHTLCVYVLRFYLDFNSGCFILWVRETQPDLDEVAKLGGGVAGIPGQGTWLGQGIFISRRSRVADTGCCQDCRAGLALLFGVRQTGDQIPAPLLAK